MRVFYVTVVLCLLFTVGLFAQPTITAVSPNSAAPGATVIVTGTGFNATAANNTVLFGTAKGTVSAASATSLTVTVPAGATYAPVSVSNAATGLTGYQLTSFIPTFNTSAYVPGAYNFKNLGNNVIRWCTAAPALGDLDGDGKPDMVIATDSFISIYKNISTTGTPLYASPVKINCYSAAYSPSSIVITDLNADGKPDIAFSNNRTYLETVDSVWGPHIEEIPGTAGHLYINYRWTYTLLNASQVTVLRNAITGGTITGSSFMRSNFLAHSSAARLAVGDMDSDGKPDLVTLNTGDATISVLRNTSAVGGLSFTKQDIIIGAPPADMAIGDLNQDNKPDIVVTLPATNRALLMRNGSTVGDFVFTSDGLLPTCTDPRAVAIGDLDGDGKPDLAIAGNDSMSLLRNTTASSSSTITFTPRVNAQSFLYYYGDMALSDMNGDGRADIVLGGTGDVKVFTNRASPGPITASSFDSGKVVYDRGYEPHDVVGFGLADIDGDGRTDVALTKYLYTTYNQGYFLLVKNSGLTFITGTTSMCQGASTTLSNVTPDGYWSSSNTAIANVGYYNGVVYGVSAGTATISYWVSGSYATANVTVNAAPVVSILAYAMCAGEAMTMTASGASTYAWSPAATLSASTGAVVVCHATTTTTYTVIGSNGVCSSVRSINVPVSGPTVAFSAPSSMCVGGSITMTASGASSYDWAFYPSSMSASTGSSITFTPTNAEVYNMFFYGYDAAGCYDSASFDITVNAAPTVSVSTPPAMCRGSSTTLTASGATTYTWAPGTGLSATTGATVTCSSTSTRTYTVTGTVAGGCSGTQTRTVTVNPLPTLSVTPTSPVYCASSSITLSASGASTYSWSPSTGLSATTGAAVTASSPTSRIYTVTGTSAAGCTSTLARSVTVNATPLSVTPASSYYCIGGNTAITATGGTSYTWAPATGLNTTTGASVNCNAITTTTYTVTASYSNGCTRSATEPITVNAIPILTVTPILSTISAGFPRTISVSGSGGYTWAPATALNTTAGSSVIASPTASITYTVTETATGCFATATSTLNVVNRPVVTSVSPNTANPGDVVTITGSSFNTTAANNIVYFGATKAQVNSATAASLSVTTPVGATCMPVSVTDLTTGLMGAEKYAYLPSYDNSPYISSVVNYDPPTGIATVHASRSVVLGDVDGDGKADMVIVGNYPNRVSVYRNISSAGTLDASSFAPGIDLVAYDFPVQVRIMDMDGDGKPEIVVGCLWDGKLCVYRNISSPGSITAASFSPRVDISSGYVFYMDISDMDGDGRPDVLVGDLSSNTLGIMKNISEVGTISFMAPVTFNVTLPFYMRGITTADFDGDGKNDVVLKSVTPYSRSRVYRNTSTPGNFTTSSLDSVADLSSSGSGYDELGTIAGDVDGDGKPDVLTGTGSGVLVFRNTSGTGISFSPGVLFVWSNVTAVKTGDINGDGKMDIVATNNNIGIISVLRNTATPGVIDASSFQNYTPFSTNCTRISGDIELGDLDGDGKPDAVVLDHDSDMLYILKNNPLAPIAGDSVICGGTITLSNATTGGTWSSSNTAIATVSATGVVTPVAAGTAVISYTVLGGSATRSIRVRTTFPNAGTISGASTLCEGSMVTFTCTISGGTWSSSTPSNASVNAAGAVYGVSGGSATIRYTVTDGYCSAVVSAGVSVTALPAPGTISGASLVCTGSAITLTHGGATSGSMWISTNPSVATVNTSGVVSGVSAGTTIISYARTVSGCTDAVTQLLTVNTTPVVGAITGPASVCTGAAITLSDTAAGGSWSVASATRATVTSGGIVTGLSAGTTTISYAKTVGGCTATATRSLTVNASPVAGVITGSASICSGVPGVLTDTAVGGTWSSTNILVATVSGSGVVTGVSAGASVISYTLSNSFCTVADTLAIAVSTTPMAGTLSGTGTMVCYGTTISLTPTVSGGTWSSSSTSRATVSPAGQVTGRYTGSSSGTATISYTLSNGFCSASATYAITSYPAPDPGNVSGTSSICVGANSSYSVSGATAGGTWSSSNTSVASVSTTGRVYGIGGGTARIYYTATNVCGQSAADSQTVTISPNPGVISGSAPVCAGLTIPLSISGGLIGGTWSSANTSIATVDTAGMVRGVAAGTAIISYTVTNSCGTYAATTSILVRALPNAGNITGTTSFCQGATTTLTDTVTGGTWSSTLTSNATVSATGSVYGVSSGSSTISYTVSDAFCTAAATRSVSVGVLADPGTISGPVSVCIGSTISLSRSSSGGTWSSANTAVATVTGGTGTTTTVRGVSGGTVVISYTKTSGCAPVAATYTVTVSSYAGVVSGATSICTGGTTTLASSIAGGTWSSVTPTRATVSSSGVVTGVSAGTSVISYAVTTGCGTTAATATVTVNNAPSVSGITASSPSLCSGAVLTLTSGSTAGGATAYNWSGPDGYTSTTTTASVVLTLTTTTASGNYSLTVSNAAPGCISAAVSTPVLVNEIPVLMASTPVTICADTSALIGAFGASTYSWLPAAGLSSTTSAVVTAAPTVTTVYTVTGSSTSGCSASSTVQVTVNALPVISVSGTVTLCSGQSSAINASGGLVFNWLPAAGLDITIGNEVIATPSATTNYTVTVMNSRGCVRSGSITVNVIDTPVLIVSNSVTLCAGASATLIASGATAYSWSGGALGVTTTEFITVAPTTTTVYAVMGTGIGGCTSTVERTVTVLPLPIVIVTAGSANICNGTSTTLTSSGAAAYSWSGGGLEAFTGSSVNVFPTAVTVYSVVGTDSNGCVSGYVTQPITVNPLADAGAIDGPSSVCAGSSISLTNAVTGGTWSSSNANASINASGVVSGVSAGTSTISYTVTNGCGPISSVYPITIHPLADAGIIDGALSVCAGSVISLTNTVTDGTWSSSNTNATVSASGVVSGVSAGTSTISYTVTNGCGPRYAVQSITVNALADAGVIYGALSVCASSAISLTNTVTDGTWSSSNTNATVSASGVVSGVSAGTSTISYTVTNGCGPRYAVQSITVNALADAGIIDGASSVCAGSVTSLTNAVSGGTWSSSNANVSVNTSGVVSGVLAGTSAISYTVTNGCGPVSAVWPVAINPLAYAGIIDGASSVCAGSVISLTNMVTGGAWSSSNTNAAVSASGVVTGVSAGITTISYTVTNSCGSDLATHIIAVNPTPNAGTISGMSSVCTGSNTTLSTTGTGGVWSSSNAAIASVSAEGMVNGVSAGDIAISYAVTNSCGTDISTQSITVNSLPSAGSLSGTTTFCAGVESTLSSTISGGSWSSEDTTVATINNFGVVAGLSAGTSAISYTVMNSCGTDVATASVTINTVPSSSTISGITTLCPGTTASLSASSVGGTWTSNNANVSIDASTGVITGVSAGTSVVSYTVSTDCGSITDTILITVNGFPLPISGPSTVCGGSTISLANASAGGIWTSSNTKALVNPSTGVVTGVASGAVSIIYTGCGVAVSYPITVLTSPGSISGTASICEGALTTLSSGVTGGAWSITGADVATINTSTRVVTGITAGSAVVSYTLVNTCFSTRTITVNPQPSSMSTPGSVCVGAVVTLSNPVAGGVWATLSSSKATVSAEGVVYAVGAGVTTIKYSIGTCVSSVPFTVNITPKAITGINSICEGAATTFANTVAGGTWSTEDAGIADINTSSPVGISGMLAGTTAITYTIGSCAVSRAITVNTAPAAMSTPDPVCVGNVVTLSNPVAGGVWTTLSSSKATVSAEGVVYAVGAGTTTIKYSIGTCVSSVPFTVNITPKAITGINSICEGAATTFANTVAGGVWSTSDAGIATVSAVAPVTVSGISDGVATIFYTIGSCAATRDVTVKVLPEAMVAPVPACVGAAVTLSNATPGGLWSSSSPTRATVSSVGVVQAISAGVSTIKYTLNGCVSSVPFTVSPTPTGISGLNTVCRGSSVTWTPNIAGGAWTTANAAIATVNSGLTNVMTGVAAGTTTITYTLGSCFTTKVLNVGSCGAKEDDEATGNGVELAGNIINVSIFPNPATSKINIKASVPVNVKLITPDGKLVMTQTDAHELAVDNLASGVYMIMVYDESGLLLKVERLVKMD